MDDAAFLFLSVVSLVSALLVVTRKHPIYGLLYLMVFFLGLTGLFVLLAAPFVAAIQVIVYVGAILVLFLFVLMLLDYTDLGGELGRSPTSFAGAVVASALLAIGLLIAIYRGSDADLLGEPPALEETEAGRDSYGSIRPVATHLYTRYALPLELVSILVMAGLVGAVSLARKVPATGSSHVHDR